MLLKYNELNFRWKTLIVHSVQDINLLCGEELTYPSVYTVFLNGMSTRVKTLIDSFASRKSIWMPDLFPYRDHLQLVALISLLSYKTKLQSTSIGNLLYSFWKGQHTFPFMNCSLSFMYFVLSKAIFWE